MICRHCGAVIRRHAWMGGFRWQDLGNRSPGTCFKARNLAHEPEPIAGDAGKLEPRGTRDEAGNETSEQPQAIRADIPK